MIGQRVEVHGFDDDRGVQAEVPAAVPFEDFEVRGDEPYERLAELRGRAAALAYPERDSRGPRFERTIAGHDQRRRMASLLSIISRSVPLMRSPCARRCVTFPSIASACARRPHGARVAPGAPPPEARRASAAHLAWSPLPAFSSISRTSRLKSGM